MKNRGLRTDNLSNFYAFLTKIEAKLELLELKLKSVIFSENWWFWRQNFTFIFQMRVLWMDLTLDWGSCERQERHDKEVLRAAHPHTPLSGECSLPPPPTSGFDSCQGHFGIEWGLGGCAMKLCALIPFLWISQKHTTRVTIDLPPTTDFNYKMIATWIESISVRKSVNLIHCPQCGSIVYDQGNL